MRSADLRSFFLLLRARSKDPDGWRRGSDTLDQKCGQAGTPQIKSNSSELELLKSTSFDLQSTTINDVLTTSNNFLQLSRSMVDVLPTSFT